MNVNRVEPAEGPSNGGIEVTIVGDAFDPLATVDFNGTDAPVTAATATELKVTAPPCAVGAVVVTVSNPDGTTAAGNYASRAPHIAAIDIATGPTAGDTVITVTGAFFVAGANGDFSGTAAIGVALDSDTQMRVQSPPMAAGPSNLTIVGPDGVVSNVVVFTFHAPTITGLDVADGPSCGGTWIRITGTYFHETAAVDFDGTAAAEVVFVDSTTVDAVTPERPAGNATLQVVNPDGATATSNAFTFHAPTFTSIEPAYGAPDGGTAARITGTWFGPATQVEIDGLVSTKIYGAGEDTLYVEIPARVAGAGAVDVRVFDANEEDDGANRFTYAVPPAMGTDDVQFLMDGEEYFEKLRQEMELVRAAPVHAQTYVRLAFWKISPDVTLGDRTHFGLAADKLVDWVGRVIMAGHKVDIIVWYPNLKDRFKWRDFAEEHEALAQALMAKDRIAAIAGAGRVRIYLERYEGYVGSSNHQKIAIFSRQGQRTALIGGFNLAQYYWDSAAHDLFQNAPNVGGWHDTAVRIEGPATDDIEAEWMRRWNRAVAMQAKLVTLNDLPNQVRARFTGVGSRNTIRQGAVAIVPNTTVQVAPARTTTVRIRTTRSSGKTRYRALRDELLTRIGAATHYVYMENNQFTDPEIVRALYNRLATTPALRIRIVTNLRGEGEGFMTRRSWLQLVLRMPHPMLRGVYYRSKTGAERYIARNGAATWNVYDSYQEHEDTWISTTLKPNQRWLLNDSLEIPAVAGGTKKIAFSRILRVDADFHFYTPICFRPDFENATVHSKLAIFDDEWLVVGTSNWTYRSMQYDGEIAGFMNSPLPGAAPTLVTMAKDSILSHFDVRMPLWLSNTGDNFEAVASYNLGDGARPNDRYMLFPLLHADQMLGDVREPPGVSGMPSFIWI